MPSDQRPTARDNSDPSVNPALAACLLVLACGAAGLAAGTGWHRIVPPVYEAEARLVLDAGAYADFGVDDLAALRSRLARAGAQANLNAAGLAQEDVRIDSPPGELTASVEVRAATADAAARGANALATAFAQGEAAYLATQADAAVAAAQRRITAYEERLAALDLAAQAWRASAEPVAPPAAAEPPLLADTEGADRRLAALEAESAALRDAAGNERTDLSALPPSLSAIGARRDEAAAELSLLSRTYGPRHPRRIEANRRLAAARAAFAQEAQRLLALRETSIAEARRDAQAQPQPQSQRQTEVPPREAVAPAPSLAAPATAALEADLAAAQASLAALVSAPRREPVDIVAPALPPAAPAGLNVLARALLGAAAGMALGLVLLCILAMARLLGRRPQQTPTILSDVPYHAVDLGGGQGPMRLVSPATVTAHARPGGGTPSVVGETVEMQQAVAEPIREDASLRQPVAGSAQAEPSPDDGEGAEGEPREGMAEPADIARSVQDLADAVRMAQANLPARPQQEATAADPSRSVLTRRDRLRQELRDMAARRLADAAGAPSGARILSPEELRKRHDARNGPTRLS